MEIWIWLVPLYHRYLARSGEFVVGMVTSLPITTGSKGKLYYHANVAHLVDGRVYNKTMPLNRTDFDLLKIGSHEILLYPNDNRVA
jgi:hypothetical protein